MKTTIKQLQEQVFSKANQHPELKDAMQNILSQVNQQSATNGMAEINQKIAEYEEELRVIELRRTVKKLRAGLDNIEVDIKQPEVDLDVPPAMRFVIRDVRPKKKK